MGVVGKTVLVGTSVAAGAVLAIWLFDRSRGGTGWGIFGGGGGGGLFGGGVAGGTTVGGADEQSGPLADDKGDGGTGTADDGGSEKNGGGGSDGAGKQSKNQDDGKSDKPGDGKSESGDKGDGDKVGGGSGGGVGGGSGGGIGSGQGHGSGGDFDEGGQHGDDNGGGADEGLYDPWEGLLIQQDLQPPDRSPKKLSELRATISDLVAYAVLDPGTFHPHLPQPLHSFKPELGGLLKFWADVAIHLEYPELPPGRLDPDIKSHVPWINLWLDSYALTAKIEAEINGALEAGD